MEEATKDRYPNQPDAEELAAIILRLQRLGFTIGDPGAMGHSGGGGNCCFSSWSTGGCTVRTGTEKLAATPTAG